MTRRDWYRLYVMAWALAAAAYCFYRALEAA